MEGKEGDDGYGHSGRNGTRKGNPKRFRAALRSDPQIDWHERCHPWRVEYGSDRLADMKRVLDQL